jgi:hypothetical protein
LLRDRESVIDLDAKISDCAFNLRMAEQQLHGSQIASSAIDQSGFGSPLSPRPICSYSMDVGVGFPIRRLP